MKITILCVSVVFLKSLKSNRCNYVLNYVSSDLISRFPYIKNDDEKWDKARGFPFLQISLYFVGSVILFENKFSGKTY